MQSTFASPRRLALLAPLLAVACSQPAATMPAGADAGVQPDPASGPSWFAPAAYQLVAFRSDVAQHDVPAPDPVVQPGRDYLAVLETDAGRIVLDLLEAQAPMTVNSFVFLALHYYFDGIAFHRVIDRFVAQGGD